VFHCHILQHEDAGMMATIQVRKSKRVPIEPPPEYRNGGEMGHMPMSTHEPVAAPLEYRDGGEMGHMAGYKPRKIRRQLADSSHLRRFCPLADRARAG
jgi:Multicopper oxidase